MPHTARSAAPTVLAPTPDLASPLGVLLVGWHGFQRRLMEAIAPLTPEQLALPVAPGQWPIGALAQHVVVNRVWWFHGWLGEGDPRLTALAAWDPKEAAPPAVAAGELVAALEATWQMVAAALARWTAADLAEAPPPPASLSDGERRVFGGWTRQQMLWHVLEHELMHAGELSLALGTHGLAAIRPI